MKIFSEIDDGFGNAREKCCEDCQMAVVRPGDIRCEICDENPHIFKLQERVNALKTVVRLVLDADLMDMDVQLTNQCKSVLG